MDLEQLQPQLFNTFQKVLEKDRLSHAYLFAGGFGSYAMALYLSRSLFCTDKVGAFPCGKCRNCQLIERGEFADVTEVAPVNQVIKTDTIRDLVRSFSQSGVEGNRQVFIVHQADRMHANAANSLLKVIEEPQSDIHIFLLTTDLEGILPTIRSRTQLFHFPKQESFIFDYLIQGGLLKDQAQIVTNYAQSLEEVEHVAQDKSFFDLAYQAQSFLNHWQKGSKRALLEAAKLASYADEKEKQDKIWRLLEIYISKELASKWGRQALQSLWQARKMNRSNVAFQSCLERLIL